MLTIDKEKLKRMVMLHVAFAIVDIRSREEFEKGHIKNAFHFESSVLIDKLNENFKRKETPIVIYDQDGKLASELVRKVEAAGFINAVMLDGGYANY
jgi:rhodanese-related sulfurtransferase